MKPDLAKYFDDHEIVDIDLELEDHETANVVVKQKTQEEKPINEKEDCGEDGSE